MYHCHCKTWPLTTYARAVRELGEKQAFGTVAALDLEPAFYTVKALDPVHALKLNAQEILSLDFELVQAVISRPLPAGPRVRSHASAMNPARSSHQCDFSPVFSQV
jgi:hypothetical protein